MTFAASCLVAVATVSTAAAGGSAPPRSHGAERAVAGAAAPPAITGGWLSYVTGSRGISSVGAATVTKVKIEPWALTVTFGFNGGQGSARLSFENGLAFIQGAKSTLKVDTTYALATPRFTTGRIGTTGSACTGMFRFSRLVPASTGTSGSFGMTFWATCGARSYSGRLAFALPNDGGQGYYTFSQDGWITGFGNSGYLEYVWNLEGLAPYAPIVGMATTPDGGGFWMAAADGGVFAAGDAPFLGSMGATHLNAPVVGIATTPTGGGYWEVAADGGIFAFGNAAYHGSMGGKPLNAPVVGMAATPTGGGYWEVAADGGIFAFGNAAYHGSMGGQPLNAPVVGMAATPNGTGYWEVASDGGVFTFACQFHGSAGNLALLEPITSMAATADGGGYWLEAADGGVFSYGDALFAGRPVPGTTPINSYAISAGIVRA